MSARKKRQSEIISARLFEDDQDEAKALAVFRRWKRDAGLNTTQIITRALLALGEHQLPQRAEPLAEQLRESIDEMRQLIERLSNGQITVNEKGQPESTSDDQLDPGLLASLKNRVAPGLRADDTE